MSNTKTPWALGSQPMPSVNGSEVVNINLVASVLAANLALNDLIIVGELPEDCAFVDAVFSASDMDSNGTPTLALSFGVVNDAETDLETVFQSGLTLARTGGATRLTPTKAALEYIAGSGGGKKLGFKVTTAAATGADGELGASVSYRAAAHGS